MGQFTSGLVRYSYWRAHGARIWKGQRNHRKGQPRKFVPKFTKERDNDDDYQDYSDYGNK